MPLRPRVALARAHPAGAAMPAAVLEQAPARIRTSAAIAEGRHCKGSLGVHGRAPQPSCLGPLAFRGRWLRSSRPQGSATCSSRIWCTQKRSPWTATRRDNPLGSSWCCRTSHLANGLLLDLGPSMAEPQGAPKQGTQEFVPVRRRTCWATLRQAAEQALEPNCCGRWENCANGHRAALVLLRKFLQKAARDRSAEHCHPAESLQLAARH